MDNIIVCKQNIALLKKEYYHIVENHLKKHKIEDVGISLIPLAEMCFDNPDERVIKEINRFCKMQKYWYVTKIGGDAGLVVGIVYEEEIPDKRYVLGYLVSYDENDVLRLLQVGKLDQYKLKESSYMLNLSATVSRNIAVDRVDATEEVKAIQNKIKEAREKGATFVFHNNLTVATKELLKLRHFSFEQTAHGVKIIW